MGQGCPLVLRDFLPAHFLPGGLTPQITGRWELSRYGKGQRSKTTTFMVTILQGQGTSSHHQAQSTRQTATRHPNPDYICRTSRSRFIIGRTELGRGLISRASSGLVQTIGGGTSTLGRRESSKVAAGLETAGAAAQQLRDLKTCLVPRGVRERPES